MQYDDPNHSDLAVVTVDVSIIAMSSRPSTPNQGFAPGRLDLLLALSRRIVSVTHAGVRDTHVHRNAGETQEGYYQPLEKAEMVRQGRDVTILCYSRMRYVVMQAVAQLEKEGYDPEVGTWNMWFGV